MLTHIIPQIFQSKSLVNRRSIKNFINHFSKGDNWHELDIDKANLGYGWIHYSLIRLLKPKRVLCVGSRYGFIPAICALACKDNQQGIVDFVDAGYSQNSVADKKRHWGGVGFWRENNVKKHFAKYGLDSYIRMNVMTSQDFKKKFPKREWGYIYLDGDHSYKGIKEDFNNFWPSLLTGGFISFHDTQTNLENDLDYGVDKFWQELKKKYPAFEFPGSNGLGVVQK
ncbi:MAG: hypothetical protein COU63_05020 [Candidatus Pacebacteria bacterium CG10_big_fil_rev_8_21_14_0_10_36_11]|nr:MAG: hypothetical protein AUK08_04730 [Candidatus Pacebacteria bacterium CG2_30_36_39]PIR64299.1 MAG: hypothetical protein COU63_05020 [Candidatus Pacebacteria bacterium CG10_big_fil_rev_8_21_14_0_10_36_11]